MSFAIRPSGPADTDRLVDIWRGAVDATHNFLDHGDRQAIETEVRAFFPSANFQVAVDSQDVPIGFMLLNDAPLEALFISPDRRGQGIGKLLMQRTMRAHEVLTVDVNEQNAQALGFYERLGLQNAQALGFYERLGFMITGRSCIDGQGRPYPSDQNHVCIPDVTKIDLSFNTASRQNVSDA